MPKTTTISFRCDPDFKCRVEKLTAAYDASISDLMEWCILHAYKEWINVQKAERKATDEMQTIVGQTHTSAE